MARYTIDLTEQQDLGWAVQLAKINAQRAENDLPPVTTEDLITEQIKNFGDQQYIRDQRAKKAFTEISTEQEAVAVLRAKGYLIQGKQ